MPGVLQVATVAKDQAETVATHLRSEPADLTSPAAPLGLLNRVTAAMRVRRALVATRVKLALLAKAGAVAQAATLNPSALRVVEALIQFVHATIMMMIPKERASLQRVVLPVTVGLALVVEARMVLLREVHPRIRPQAACLMPAAQQDLLHRPVRPELWLRTPMAGMVAWGWAALEERVGRQRPILVL